MPKLIITKGNQTAGFAIKKDITTIGRSDDNNLPLKDIKVSRAHCQIVKTPSGYKIVDLNSGNGTRVNNEKVMERILQDKDLIKVGDVLMIFDSMESSPTTQTSMETIAEKIPDSNDQPDMDYQSTVIVKPASPVKPTPAPAGVEEIPVVSIDDNEPPPVRPSTPPMKPSGAGLSKPSRFKKAGKSLSRKIGRSKMTNTDDSDSQEDSEDSPPPPKKSKALLIGVVIIAVVIGAIIIVSNKGKGDSSAKPEESDLYKKIQEASRKDEYQAGLKLCEDFLEKYKTSKLLPKVKDLQDKLRSDQSQETDAEHEWNSLKAKADSAKPEEKNAVITEIKSFVEKYDGTKAAKEAEAKLETLEKPATTGEEPK